MHCLSGVKRGETANSARDLILMNTAVINYLYIQVSERQYDLVGKYEIKI